MQISSSFIEKITKIYTCIFNMCTWETTFHMNKLLIYFLENKHKKARMFFFIIIFVPNKDWNQLRFSQLQLVVSPFLNSILHFAIYYLNFRSHHFPIGFYIAAFRQFLAYKKIWWDSYNVNFPLWWEKTKVQPRTKFFLFTWYLHNLIKYLIKRSAWIECKKCEGIWRTYFFSRNAVKKLSSCTKLIAPIRENRWNRLRIVYIEIRIKIISKYARRLTSFGQK